MITSYLSAFFLGALHALEVDHMVAVSAFVGGRPNITASVGFGVRWGLGHAIAILAVGGTMAVLGLHLPGSFTVWGERLVGVALIILGIWAFRRASRLHVHEPPEHGDHGHLHAHAADEASHRHAHAHPGRHHRHGSTLIGAIHGLAGSAPVVALIPVTLIESTPLALGYLAMFGLGTVCAMAVFAIVAAVAVGGMSRWVVSLQSLARVMAVASAAVGVWWLVG